MIALTAGLMPFIVAASHGWILFPAPLGVAASRASFLGPPVLVDQLVSVAGLGLAIALAASAAWSVRVRRAPSPDNVLLQGEASWRRRTDCLVDCAGRGRSRPTSRELSTGSDCRPTDPIGMRRSLRVPRGSGAIRRPAMTGTHTPATISSSSRGRWDHSCDGRSRSCCSAPARPASGCWHESVAPGCWWWERCWSRPIAPSVVRD